MHWHTKTNEIKKQRDYPAIQINELEKIKETWLKSEKSISKQKLPRATKKGPRSKQTIKNQQDQNKS